MKGIRAIATNVTNAQMEEASHMFHKKLCLGQSRFSCRLTVSDCMDMFSLKRSEASILYRKFNIPETKAAVLKKVASMTIYDERSVITSKGSIVNQDFLHWCGGIFDGDGCVLRQENSSVIQLRQNSPLVSSFYHALGGRWRSYGREHIWVVKGHESYFVAKILCNYTLKKRPELLTLIDLHECNVDIEEYSRIVRRMKDDYMEQSFDNCLWEAAYMAGLIDSDGSISVVASQKCRPYLAVGFYQNNRNFCEIFRLKFGGSVSKNGGVYLWKVVGEKAKVFLNIISPHLQHKKTQSKIALKYFGQYDDQVVKEMHAFNSLNNKSAYNSFTKKYGKCPHEFKIRSI